MVSRGKLLLKKNSLSQANCHSFRCPYLCTCIIKWFMATCLHFILVAWTTLLVPFFVGLDFFYTTDFFAGWLVLRSCLVRKGWWQGEDTRFIHWGVFFNTFLWFVSQVENPIFQFIILSGIQCFFFSFSRSLSDSMRYSAVEQQR